MRKRSFLRLGLALLLAMSTLLSSAVGAFAAAGDPDTPEEPSGGRGRRSTAGHLDHNIQRDGLHDGPAGELDRSR